MAVQCNICNTPLKTTFVNLGMAPLVSSYLNSDTLLDMEPTYPLHTYVCECCFLVQLPEAEKPENIFSEYPYFSSVSDSWLEHAKRYVEMMVERFEYHEPSQIIEIASNDGYLLKNFLQKGIKV